MKSKILIVEDEKDLIKLLEYNLKKAGFEVVSALDGPEAIKLAREKKPDLVILDIMLPSLEGTEVCKMLKQDESTTNIPIIMLSAKGEEVDRIVGFELGADDYITKPFSPRELILRVKAILKRSTSGSIEKLIKAGPLVIDAGRRLVSAGDKIIRLTTREFDLLITLARARGRVLTREMLLDMVWGEECYITDRTVDTHIKRLREKLEHYGEYIETVRGFGYRFREEM